MGWNRGGPTRICTSTLRSSPSRYFHHLQNLLRLTLRLPSLMSIPMRLLRVMAYGFTELEDGRRIAFDYQGVRYKMIVPTDVKVGCTLRVGIGIQSGLRRASIRCGGRRMRMSVACSAV